MSSPSNEAESIDDMLVAYALGALEQSELREVAEMLRERPDLRQRLAELQTVAGYLPYGLPAAEPAPDLRARVIARATGAEQPRPAPRPQRAGRLGWRGLSALLGGLAAVLLVAAIVLAGQVSGQQQQLAQQQEQLAQQQQTLDRQAAQLGEQQQLVSMLSTPGAQFATLNDPTGGAVLVRTPNDGAAIAAQLPPLAADRTYQLWLIAGEDQPPTSAGLLSVSAEGEGVLLLPPSQPTLREAAVFAITVEPSGGSLAPTTPPLVSNPFGLT
jgi:anti-sigma-K factor RskA